MNMHDLILPYFLAGFLVVLPAAFLGEAFFAGAFVAFLVAITFYS